MYGQYWHALSDHRPILSYYSGAGLQRYTRMKHGPARLPAQLNRIVLKGLVDHKKRFRDAMLVLVADLPAHLGPVEAGDRLLHLSQGTIKGVPDPPLYRLLRSPFKDGWSPQLVAAKAQLGMLV